MTTRLAGLSVAALGLVLLAGPAAAHPGHDHGGLIAGVLHPLSGADHLAAMLAVGLWAGIVGGVRRWAWPATFVIAMVVGVVAGWSALPAPGVEMEIAASIAALGGAIALGWSPPLAIGAIAIAAFGAAHGFAHGAGMASGALLDPHAAGLVAATAALHAAGLALAPLLVRGRPLAPRLAGGALASLGFVLVAGSMLT
ncbi:HupE/UreJ family protein [Elioraea sp.]|uniref:HupE/UreJ family protein n=1 Tax=Elioraea sp. TaxID=2185103 RepID=UPI0025C5CCEE|nr:HupE/UreJ family protein [Elioraea sp.]